MVLPLSARFFLVNLQPAFPPRSRETIFFIEVNVLRCKVNITSCRFAALKIPFGNLLTNLNRKLTMETLTKVVIDPCFAQRIPHYRAMIIEADVVNSETSDGQKLAMEELAAGIAARYEVGAINSIPAIAATRAAYKACGKDPNRYRPSQEQMMRRIVRGLGLYNVNAIVDAGNQLSLLSGCSVGCFDAEKVVGTTLTLGIGREGEPYEGIGRGTLNIAGLPVFRDSVGGIGTPTSDNERTRISLSTRRLLVTVHLFDPAADPDGILSVFTSLFTAYAAAGSIRHSIVSA